MPSSRPAPACSQLPPESGLVYDFMYEKRDTGRWVRWIDTVDKALLQIPANAKVTTRGNARQRMERTSGRLFQRACTLACF